MSGARLRRGATRSAVSSVRPERRGFFSRANSALLVALTICALLYGAHRFTRRITPADPGIAASVQGVFTRDGQNPGAPLLFSAGVRFWGSYVGDDAHTGRLTLGPFPAPTRLRFATDGYPNHEGNQLFVELVSTGQRAPILNAPAGERWQMVDFDLPKDWVGQPVFLNAVDDSKTLGGWLALSEPVHGGRGDGDANLWETLSAWSINGLLLGLLYFGGARWLARRAWVPAHWLPLASLAAVAAGGTLAFWVYFAHPVAGKFLSLALLAGAVVSTLKQSPAAQPTRPDFTAVTYLLLGIGLLYVALLHVFPSSLDFYSLAANRFREGLPGDNTLPRNVAFALFHGHGLHWPGADWLASDRPPLQSGWQLLPWPVTDWLGLDEGVASGTAAVWFQLTWVAAAYGWFRQLGLPRARASAWVAVISLTGFFVQHTVFTWPKLSAGAFACGAFALWMLPAAGPRRRALVLGGAVFAGLAWLSHGGVAFSFLALAPWIAWRIFRGEGRAWLLAGLVFSLAALPWLAFQKFSEPPGNRLLKWHLAGQIEKDTRATWPTIRESYRALTWSEILANKTANLRLQVRGDWRVLGDFSSVNAFQRRADEFFLTRHALTWWVLGLVALPLALVRATSRRRLRVFARPHAALALWTLGSILAWCGLMFGGGQAVIHQGSYAVMIALFVVLSAWLELVGPWTLVAVAVLQGASFVTTWAGANSVLHGPPSRWALGLALASAAALLVFLVRAHLATHALRRRLEAGEKAGHTRGRSHTEIFSCRKLSSSPVHLV